MKRPHLRTRRAKVLAGVGVAVVLVVVAAGLWFFVGRDDAHEVDHDDAVASFRAKGGAATEAAGRPAAGVYRATVSGNESIGLPGFDEGFGPTAPVTVTHADGGCFAYRVDFNSHHFRSWTFCPTPTATFSLSRMDGWTARKAPGLDISTFNSYPCPQPVDFLWPGAAPGDTRAGVCHGTSDLDDKVTDDHMSVEVVDVGPFTVGDERVDAVHLRSTEKLSRAQTGTEVDEWWLDARTGLPLKLTIGSSLKGGPSDYSERATLVLSTTTPAT